MASGTAAAPPWGHRLRRFLGAPVVHDLRPYWHQVDAIEAQAETLRPLSDEALRSSFGAAARAARHEHWHGPRTAAAVAAVREAARRTLGQWMVAEQLIAGLAMLEGRIAELATGEGKTLAAVAPVALRAATGTPVHVISSNDYLARRDALWMGPVYELLGLEAAWINAGSSRDERRAAYAAPICYLTAHELGFDFLRDRLCLDSADLVQAELVCALVDEADSILIDEARIPLVIAGHESAPPESTDQLARLAARLEPDRDFETDDEARNVFITDAGAQRIEEMLGCGELFAVEQLHLLTELRNALHARALLHRDVDYIVRGDRVELVDDFSGRVAELRRWPDGLQAAVEAKERVAVQHEGRILGSITVRHLLEHYEHLAGMTATAATAAEELAETYGLEVVVIPSHCRCRREDLPDLVYSSRTAKMAAVVAEVLSAHERGRPVLVGTASVAESEELAAALRAAGLALEVLNARQDAHEAAVVARAGARGAVTISTNMAGRGTDIRLGGPDEADREAVVALGGLFVIGTNRHESRRVDQQLRGRAGRQGDPGASRFFISLEDPLFEGSGLAETMAESAPPAQRTAPLESAQVARAVESAQRIVEGANFDARRRLDRYASLIETQRQTLQGWRQDLLCGLEKPLRLTCDPEGTCTHSACRQPAPIQRALAKRLLLLAADTCWADHLSDAQRIRDGIHVVGFVGRDPLTEYTRELGEAFSGLRDQIHADALSAFCALELGADGRWWEQDELQGPAATWTYMIQDDAFGNNGLRALANRAGPAAAAALFAGPALLLWSLALKWRRGLDKRPHSG